MNATRKLLVKLEICRSFFDNLESDTEKATLLWMEDEFATTLYNICVDIGQGCKRDLAIASKFVDQHKETIKSWVPDKIEALFLISSINYILGDLYNTKKYKYVESLVDGCYEMDERTGGDESIKQRKMSSKFAEKLDVLINNG